MMKNSQTKLVESFTLGVSQSEMNRIRQWYRNTVNISDIQTDQYGYEYVTLLFTKRKGSPSWRLSKFRGKINATSNTGGLQTFESFEDAVDTLNRRYGQEMASASDMKKIQKSTRESRLVESAIRKIANVMMKNKPTRINEAVKGLNLEQPHSNLFIKGWGMDKNGNQVIIVGFPNDRGFSIQTNGTLPETHYIISRAFKELSEDELDVVGEEITDYVKKHGSSAVKGRLKTYGKRV